MDACEFGCDLCRMLWQAKVGVLALDQERRCRYINAVGEEFLGVPASQALGRGAAELAGPFGKAIRDGLSEMDRTGQQWWERRVRHSARSVAVHLTRMQGRRGQFGGAVVWIQPETEEQDFLRHAHQAEKMVALGELAAAVAHEINSPLSGILECMRIVEASEDQTAAFERFGGLMGRGLEQIHRTVERILSFSRTPPGGRKRVALEEVVGNVVELMQMRARAEGVDLRTARLGRCEMVVDADGMGQVLMNLINNAIDAVRTTSLKQVTVGMSAPSADGVSLYVADSGRGIEPELIERVFDPFFTSKPTGQGTGLGLSVSANIVRAHGGRIVFSARPGGGTLFEVKLPRAPAEPRR